MARVLVLGANGQLGRELRRARVPQNLMLLFAGSDEIDITSGGAPGALAAMKPDAIINAAAYTAVDRAESEPDLAFAINAHAAGKLAAAAARTGARFLHISTDYVFGGDQLGHYIESDIKTPLNVYGRSKSEGEDVVLAQHPDALVLRTSWVYSPFGSNFVKSMLRLGETREEVCVVADQIGRPTAASDLAAACLALVARQLAGDAAASGIFHYAGDGEASWADVADAVFSEAARHGRDHVRVTRISTAEYPTPAKRPANSRLDTTKIETRLGIDPRPWRDALSQCVSALLNP
jgi:dTDP-4-dehydrorhamnose reductase